MRDGRCAQNLKKSDIKSHKSYGLIFLDTTYSHNRFDKKPLTLLKKEQETLTLRKRPQGPGKKWKNKIRKVVKPIFRIHSTFRSFIKILRSILIILISDLSG